MPQDNDATIRIQLEEKLLQRRRLVDQALETLTIFEIQKLVAEIEAELAGNDDQAA